MPSTRMRALSSDSSGRFSQIVGKVGQLMQKQVGGKRANGAGERRAVEDVADDRLRAHGCQSAGLLGRSRHGANGVTSVNEQR